MVEVITAKLLQENKHNWENGFINLAPKKKNLDKQLIDVISSALSWQWLNIIDILTRPALPLKDGDSGVEQHLLSETVLQCLAQEKMPLLFEY